jgi:hypothetical protein
MKIGNCKLCLRKSVELRRSHFIPAAAYKSAFKSSDGAPPVIMNSSVTMITSAQVADYVLCGDCEQRLNEGGER